MVADRRAMKIVEPSFFLATIKKIDRFQLPQLEKRNGGGLRASIRSHIPSIKDRIKAAEEFTETEAVPSGH